MKPRDRVILALDVDKEDEALALVEKVAGNVWAFKVGMQLFNSAGQDIVRRIQDLGGRVFVDLKFHDIPNTVARAVRVVTRLGCLMLDVHASGGTDMMRAAAEAALDEAARLGIPAPLILAVTVLTSIDQRQLEEELLIRGESVERVAAKWARMAQSSGISGAVCSPREIAAVRAACGPDFVIVTPGIRPAWAANNDQKRALTPGEAIKLGADYVVVGRPITHAEDPACAARMVIEEMEGTSCAQ
ncbi:MAG: orotidine-5'-phosphate decarboxylase [Firmicutes bacterium]|nr:orotidine-5'-phosphate decarboxylase [Bacillota bacterium]